MADADELLFAYGSLRFAEVQLDTFGRVVASDADALPGYRVDYVESGDRNAAGPAGPSVRPVLRATGNTIDKVVGRVLYVTGEELEAADEYEASRFRRIAVPLRSGRRAWVYVG